MIQLLPTEILDKVDPTYHFNDTLIRCLLDVYLDYPDELHNFPNNYWLAGKKTKVTNNCCPIISCKSEDIIYFFLVKIKS